MEKMIKLSAVFKVKDEEDEMILEMAITYDADKADKKGRTIEDLYESLKKLATYQVKQVNEDAEVSEATADEVKEHYEQE